VHIYNEALNISSILLLLSTANRVLGPRRILGTTDRALSVVCSRPTPEKLRIKFYSFSSGDFCSFFRRGVLAFS